MQLTNQGFLICDSKLWGSFYNSPGLFCISRYTTDNYQCSGTFGLSGIHLCYYQRASKQLQIGVELEANPRMQEAVASIGYQVDLPKSDVVFKGRLKELY